MLRIYLGSPYTHSDPDVMEERYLAACLKAGQLAKEGYFVYSPIVHWHPIAKLCDLPRAWEFWQRLDKESIQLMDEVWILKLKGWEVSIGIENEMIIAREFNKPCTFIDP